MVRRKPVLLVNQYFGRELINISAYIVLTIKELAELIKDVIGYKYGLFLIWLERKVF